MNSVTAYKDILLKLENKRGRMKKDDLLCSFTSGEWPSDMLPAVLTEGIDRLIKDGKITLIDDEYVTMPSMPSVPS